MKIRIKGNTIRFRLTKTEVRQLAEEGLVEDATYFPAGNSFRYSLRTAASDENQVTFADGEISITLSIEWAKEWNANDAVGTSFEVPTPTSPLSVLVEKDFNCLVIRDGEDESDHFKNPLSEHPPC